MEHEVNNDTARRGLRQTIQVLKAHHPCYAARIDRREWYVEVYYINFFGRGAIGSEAVDFGSIRLERSSENTNEYGYWMPPKEVRTHIVKQSEQEIHRLNPVSPDLQNKNFDLFHSKFDEKLRDCEINDTVRISDFSNGKISIVKATYLDQVGTNITADTYIETTNEEFRGRTLRQIDTFSDGRLRPFNSCLQANTIGVAAIAVDKDDKLFFPFREYNSDKARGDDVRRRLGAMERGWHCFSSGVLDWSDIDTAAGQSSINLFMEGLTAGILREILYETGLTREEHTFDVAPYAMARELKRPGKPQFFFLVRFRSMTSEQIVESINRKLSEGAVREITEYALKHPKLGSLKFLNRLMKRRTAPQRRIWSTNCTINSLLNDGFLSKLSNEGWEEEFPTYELYGALYILRDALRSGHMMSWQKGDR